MNPQVCCSQPDRSSSCSDPDSAELESIRRLIVGLMSEPLPYAGGSRAPTSKIYRLYEEVSQRTDGFVSRRCFYAVCAAILRAYDESDAVAGDFPAAGLGSTGDLVGSDDEALIRLGDVLDRIERQDPCAVRCFELVHLAGHRATDVARSLRMPIRDVMRHVASVRAWFLYELEYGSAPGA